MRLIRTNNLFQARWFSKSFVGGERNPTNSATCVAMTPTELWEVEIGSGKLLEELVRCFIDLYTTMRSSGAILALPLARLVNE